ncbi:MAG: ATP-binding cassette domain-containing protein [Alphaproteobacteria bacterium]|nr:ATP-binding cassette domain-containing protein [Alphaproteobacteria bacterium]
MSAASTPLIEVRGLKTAFGTHVIHDGLNLEVRRGEIMGLVGGSGTGKSVLMNTMIGLKRPDAGEIFYNGRALGKMADSERARLESHWGVLFQGGALFSALTVRENVMAPMREHTDLPRSLMSELADMKIALTGLGPEAPTKFPSELSGGMKKRAGLARALALDPDVLFLDEPTAGLDPIGAAAFDSLIRELRDALGLTVFIVTHDLDTLFAICDRVAVLAEKRCVAVAPIDELLQNDHPWIREYFRGPRGRAATMAREG